MNIGVAVLLLLWLAGVAGCGYQVYPAGGQAGKISKDIAKIFVSAFTNNTPEANIETSFRNAFIDQFSKGRRFKIVDSAGLADAVLKGDIRNLVVSPLAYRGDSNLAVEKRITVTLSLTLEANGATLWRDASFSQWGDYSLDGKNLSAGQAGQKNALSKLADDVAERAYRIMMADF
ncbi:MAG: LPS assembly lipoprotein LptE [Syntrophales bacterium LBB04]|nr:LPS assembly lipoprotein LptE [Syntrophales bacterium LBB04]